MNNKEFLNEFDLLYNNIRSNMAPSLNEYEISLFLTEAQEVLVKEFYTGKNAFRQSFEKDEEVTRSLSSLVRTFVTSEEYSPEFISDIVETISPSSSLYKIPEEVWYIIKEGVKLDDELGCYQGQYIDVVPVRHDKVSSITRNPFRREGDFRVLRLSIADNLHELISKYPIMSYMIRYIVQPSPIILTDLGDLSINGISVESECKLHEAVHRDILTRAVYIAAGTYKQQ